MNDKTRDPAHMAGAFLAAMIGGSAGADVVVLATPDGIQIHVLNDKAAEVAKAAGESLKDRETDRDGAISLLRKFVDGGCKVLGVGGDGEPSWLTAKPQTVPEGATIQ